MSEPVYPVIAGVEAKLTVSPIHSTIKLDAASGRSVRVANFAYPLQKFAIDYTILDASAAVAQFQTLFGFFNAMHGRFQTFLYTHPYDNTVTAQPVATGDGTTRVFQLIRTLGGGVAAVYAPIIAGTSVSPAGATIDPLTGLITYGTAPAGGTAITWSGSYYWRCSLDNDTQDFSTFCYGLWDVNTISFTSVK